MNKSLQAIRVLAASGMLCQSPRQSPSTSVGPLPSLWSAQEGHRKSNYMLLPDTLSFPDRNIPKFTPLSFCNAEGVASGSSFRKLDPKYLK